MFDPETPVRTDAELVAHVTETVGAALRRQTWLLLFDEDDRPLPVVIPVDGMPLHPDREDVGLFVERLQMLVRETGAAGLVVVWERPGTAVLRAADRVWVDGFRAIAHLRAQLLSSDSGLRLLDAGPPLGALSA